MQQNGSVVKGMTLAAPQRSGPRHSWRRIGDCCGTSACRRSLLAEGGEPGIILQTSTRIGAIPLLSPVSGRPDFGLVVEPRFTWSSAGDMLAGTGFRIVPELLPLPNLPQSERRVPPWVMSSVVLARLKRLLDAMQRRFTVFEADLLAPRGAVAVGDISHATAAARARSQRAVSLSGPSGR